MPLYSDPLVRRLVEFARKIESGSQESRIKNKDFSYSSPGFLGSRLTQFDSRSRNSMGEYAQEEAGGIDPNSMAAAYGPPAVTPVNPMTPSHIEKIKSFFAGRRSRPQTDMPASG